MGIKKQFGMGVMSAALGLALVGGGTFAAFNDVEAVDNTFAAGTLDLVVGEDTTLDFELTNLKPGDYFTKSLTLKNGGSLKIDDILADFEVSGWENHGESNTEQDFLNQFDVTVSKGGSTLLETSLKNLVELDGYDIALSGTNAALNPTESTTFDVTFKFVDDLRKKDNGEYVQNKYQGEGATIEITFEATQMPGEDKSND